MNFFRFAIVCLTAAILSACGSEGPGAGAAHDNAPTAPIDEKAEQAVEVRESVLILMKWNYLPLAGMARDRVPYDLDTVRQNAPRLRQLSHMLADSFVYDTRGSGAHTEALDHIWVDTDLFADKIKNLVHATDALEVAAQNGDEGGIKSAIGTVGKACGSCHDEFREDDD